MISFIKLIRIPNLFIVGFIQVLIYYWILNPIFKKFGIDSIFDHILFPLFILVTMIITASGNIINDIIDVNIDKINKPEKWIVGNIISIRNAYKFYFTMIGLGFGISLYIAFEINKLHFIFFYIFAVLFLFFYSKYLKKSFLLGNIFVSLFSAGVLGILLVFESQALNNLKEIDSSRYLYIMKLILGFMTFSFLTSIYRELVKDIEDMKGDQIVKAKTLPIVLGETVAKYISVFIGVVVLIFLMYWLNDDINNGKIYLKLYILLFLMSIIVYSLLLLIKSKVKINYNKVSYVIKIVMVAGISMLLFYI